MESDSKNNNVALKLAIIGLISGVINGLFGSGGGMIVVPALIFIMGTEDHKAHATAILIILPLTLMSSYMYLSSNAVDWSILWKVTAGGIAGGFAGAKLLGKISQKWLRRVFGMFIIAGAIRMLIG